MTMSNCLCTKTSHFFNVNLVSLKKGGPLLVSKINIIYLSFLKSPKYMVVKKYELGLGVMVINATFNNISVISWWSVLLVKETRVHWENHQPAASHWQTLSHNVVSSSPHLTRIRTHNIIGDRHWLHR